MTPEHEFRLARIISPESIKPMPASKYTALVLILCCYSLHEAYSETRLAVASNFYPTLQQMTQAIERESDNSYTLISGSSGKLYAQIRAGAPFSAFFSADMEKPRALLEHFELPQDRLRIYAIGQLALWLPKQDPETPFDFRQFLQAPSTQRIALANPKLAPYGAAAYDLLRQNGIASQPHITLIYGENISQAFHFTNSGAVDAGFIAVSLIKSQTKQLSGTVWTPEAGSYPKIEQAALVLQDDPAVIELFKFLRTAEGALILSAAGYEIPNEQL